MANPAHPDIDQEIADLERRMTLRRDRLKTHTDEATSALKSKFKPVPIIATVSLAAAGFLIAKLARNDRVRDKLADYGIGRRPSFADRYRHYRDRYREEYRDAEDRRASRRGRTLGRLAAIGAALVRFGLSPQGRYLWNAVNERRMRYAAYGRR